MSDLYNVGSEDAWDYFDQHNLNPYTVKPPATQEDIIKANPVPDTIPDWMQE